MCLESGCLRDEENGMTAVVIKAKATHAAQTKAKNKQAGERKEMEHRCQPNPWSLFYFLQFVMMHKGSGPGLQGPQTEVFRIIVFMSVGSCMGVW